MKTYKLQLVNEDSELLALAKVGVAETMEEYEREVEDLESEFDMMFLDTEIKLGPVFAQDGRLPPGFRSGIRRDITKEEE